MSCRSTIDTVRPTAVAAIANEDLPPIPRASHWVVHQPDGNALIERTGKPRNRNVSADPEQSAFERHYRIRELAEMWNLGRATVRVLVKDEPGVIKIRLGRKSPHTIYSVPESVAVRIHTRLLNSR